MSNRKNHNSVVFLATLGVYLGLVLVGGQAPQVYAHGAITRNFELKDEFEVKDDLDTKPDDERSPIAASVQIYLEDVEYFLANLGRLKNKGKFDPQADTFNVTQNSLLPCLDSNRAGRYTPVRFESSSRSLLPVLELFSRGMVYGYSLGDCLTNNEFSVSAVDSRFNIQLDREAFSVNIAVKKQSSQKAYGLLREIESTIKLYSAQGNTDLRQGIIKTTSFRAENDQVFIVTRLPRAGLDSLLAKDAK